MLKNTVKKYWLYGKVVIYYNHSKGTSPQNKGERKKMKRNLYFVKSYDGKIEKRYTNYKSAVNYCNKLIWKDINCGIYTIDENTFEMVCIIGC